MSIFRRNKGGQAIFDPLEMVDHSPRMVFPHGPFAGLITDPPEAADEAYDAFVRFEMTPVVAEREISRILAGCGITCEALESQAMFRYAYAQQPTTAGQLRTIVHWLVQMQNSHESNRRLLRMFERSGNVRRVTIMLGCCPVCDRITHRRYRISQAPDLPIDGCERHGGCMCTWVPALD